MSVFLWMQAKHAPHVQPQQLQAKGFSKPIRFKDSSGLQLTVPDSQYVFCLILVKLHVRI